MNNTSFDHAAFLTGSRVYGFPNDNSDWDIVVFVGDAVIDNGVNSKEYPSVTARTVIRHGPWNLILCKTTEQFQAWHEARDRCKRLSPISRNQAIEIHKVVFQSLKGYTISPEDMLKEVVDES